MVVVNAKENIKKKILYVKMKKRSETFLKLLDALSSQGKKMGVKRNNYYLFSLDAIYHLPPIEVDANYSMFRKITYRASQLFFTYVMFVL